LPEPIKAVPPPEGGGKGDSLNRQMHDAAQFGSTWGSHIALPDLHEE
jgi:hypothetical protein